MHRSAGPTVTVQSHPLIRQHGSGFPFVHDQVCLLYLLTNLSVQTLVTAPTSSTCVRALHEQTDTSRVQHMEAHSHESPHGMSYSTSCTTS